MLADAHVAACAGNARRAHRRAITQVPLGKEYLERFGQPYAVTHRADLHATYLRACQGSNRITLENNRRVVDHDDDGDGVTVRLSRARR